MSKKDDAASALTLVLLAIIFIVAVMMLSVVLFLVAPGAAVVALIAYFLELQMDFGQAWVFAMAISCIILLGYHLFFRNSTGTKNAYFFTCGIVACFYALASVGFHAGWANAQLAYFLPSMKDQRTTESAASATQVSNGAALASLADQVSASAPAPAVSATLAASIMQPEQASLVTLPVPVAVTESVMQSGFDCSGIELPVEKMICDNGELAALDRQLLALYRQMRLGEESQQIRQEQIQWLDQQRNTCGDLLCLFTVYQARIDDFKKRVAER